MITRKHIAIIFVQNFSKVFKHSLQYDGWMDGIALGFSCSVVQESV